MRTRGRDWVEWAAATFATLGVAAAAWVAAQEGPPLRRAVAASAVLLTGVAPLFASSAAHRRRRREREQAQAAEDARRLRQRALLLDELLDHVTTIAGFLDRVLPVDLLRGRRAYPDVGTSLRLRTDVYEKLEDGLLDVNEGDVYLEYYRRARGLNAWRDRQQEVTRPLVVHAAELLRVAVGMVDDLIATDWGTRGISDELRRRIHLYEGKRDWVRVLVAMVFTNYSKLRALKSHLDLLPLVHEDPERARLYGITAELPESCKRIPPTIREDPERHWEAYLPAAEELLREGGSAGRDQPP